MSACGFGVVFGPAPVRPTFSVAEECIDSFPPCHLSVQLIEAHAVDTYGEFVDANESLLRQLPPPLVAVTYYRGAVSDVRGAHTPFMHAVHDCSTRTQLTEGM